MSWSHDFLLREAIKRYTPPSIEAYNHVCLVRRTERSTSWWGDGKPHVSVALNLLHTPDPNAAIDYSGAFEVWGYYAEGTPTTTFPPHNSQLMGRFDATCTASIIYFPFHYIHASSPVSATGAPGIHLVYITKNNWFVGGVTLPSLVTSENRATLYT